MHFFLYFWITAWLQNKCFSQLDQHSAWHGRVVKGMGSILCGAGSIPALLGRASQKLSACRLNQFQQLMTGPGYIPIYPYPSKMRFVKQKNLEKNCKQIVIKYSYSLVAFCIWIIRTSSSVIETALICKLEASAIHDRVGLGLNSRHINASPCPSPLGHARLLLEKSVGDRCRGR